MEEFLSKPDVFMSKASEYEVCDVFCELMRNGEYFVKNMKYLNAALNELLLLKGRNVVKNIFSTVGIDRRRFLVENLIQNEEVKILMAEVLLEKEANRDLGYSRIDIKEVVRIITEANLGSKVKKQLHKAFSGLSGDHALELLKDNRIQDAYVRVELSIAHTDGRYS